MLFDGIDTPRVAVELDLGGIGWFTLGVSVLGGADLLGTVTPVWTPVPDTDVRSVSTRRGRTREDQAVQAGVAAVVLDNRTGAYDPDNPDSPYAWNKYSVLTRGLPFRVSATLDLEPSGSLTVVIFSGFIEKVEPDQSLDPVSTITATDALAWLGAKTLPEVDPPIYSGDSTATRAARILDAVSWPAAARQLSGSLPMRDTKLGDTALALLDEVGRCEAGRLFASRDGDVVLSTYQDMYTTPMRLAFSDERTDDTIEYDTIHTSPGALFLVNRIRLTMAEDAAVTVRDDASIGRFGEFGKQINAPLLNATDATAIAQATLDRYAFPQTRVDRIEFDPPGLGQPWSDLLHADLGDRATTVRNTVDGRRRTYTCVIESLNHDITPTKWRVTLDMSPASSSIYFVLATSTLGGPDQLYY